MDLNNYRAALAAGFCGRCRQRPVRYTLAGTPAATCARCYTNQPRRNDTPRPYRCGLCGQPGHRSAVCAAPAHVRAAKQRRDADALRHKARKCMRRQRKAGDANPSYYAAKARGRCTRCRRRPGRPSIRSPHLPTTRCQSCFDLLLLKRSA
jgi:hypothetical protein